MEKDSQKCSPEDILTDYLLRHKLRKTPERFMILSEIYKIDGHFDIEWLFRHLKSMKCNVSKATIYNTMEVLTACRLVIRHDFDTARATYEKNSVEDHNHTVCLGCGKVVEFKSSDLKELDSIAQQSSGYKIFSHRIYLYGLCPECQKKTNL